MQVPERLALIGGGILLSSLLVFTLKNQASNLLPKIAHPLSSIYDHAGDTQYDVEFGNGYQYAQKDGWTTGTWGTAKYYIDDNHNMYVGKGKLQAGATLRNVLGDDKTDTLKTLNITQPIQAPQDSGNLFSTSNGGGINNSSLQQINGLENVDTSQVTNMFNMFTNDYALNSINGINRWNVSNVTNMGWMFNNISSLRSLDLSDWHTPNLRYAGGMFQKNDNSLESLNISNFDTTHANMENAYNLKDLHQITLGNKTYPQNDVGIPGNWEQGNTTISGYDLSSPHPAPDSHSNAIHPGTWIKR